MNNFATAITAIHKMDDNQLNAVVQAVKDRRTYLARQTAGTFQVGDTVSFAARGMQVVGTVTKINVKTVQVRQNNSLTVWKVHASLLKPVKNMVDNT
jgi:sulfate adenylyltransferase subunit 1 (EFTu-like GTPase family)